MEKKNKIKMWPSCGPKNREEVAEAARQREIKCYETVRKLLADGLGAPSTCVVPIFGNPVDPREYGEPNRPLAGQAKYFFGGVNFDIKEDTDVDAMVSGYVEKHKPPVDQQEPNLPHIFWYLDRLSLTGGPRGAWRLCIRAYCAADLGALWDMRGLPAATWQDMFPPDGAGLMSYVRADW